MKKRLELPSEEQSREALTWIVQILKSHQIPFQIVGGLAAKALVQHGPSSTLISMPQVIDFKTS